MKRGRPRHNQGRNPNQNRKPNPNRALESNGPGIKVRGAASTIFDKYTQLAHDATTSGDRVSAEYYYQYAEHYGRLVQAQVREREKREEEQRLQREARQAEFDARKAARQAERETENEPKVEPDIPESETPKANTVKSKEPTIAQTVKPRRTRKPEDADNNSGKDNGLPGGMQMMAEPETATTKTKSVEATPTIRRRVRRPRVKAETPAEASET